MQQGIPLSISKALLSIENLAAIVYIMTKPPESAIKGKKRNGHKNNNPVKILISAPPRIPKLNVKYKKIRAGIRGSK